MSKGSAVVKSEHGGEAVAGPYPGVLFLEQQMQRSRSITLRHQHPPKIVLDSYGVQWS